VKVLYVSEVQWLSQVSRKHLLVRRFPEGWDVVFASPINAKSGENSFRLRTDERDPRVRFISLPLPKPDSLFAPVRAATEILARVGGDRLRGLVRSYRPDVVVCSFIWAAPVVPFIQDLGIPVVYDCNDLHADFYPARADMAERAFRSLAAGADEVVASSENLRRVCGRGIVIGNGVDLDTFAGREVGGPLPAALARSEIADCDALVAYVGSIDARIDLDIVEGLVESFAVEDRRIGLVCVGRVLETLAAQTEELGRRFSRHVLFTGQKPYEELPAYLRSATVGIAPFLVNERTEAVNPNKLYMYAAMDMNVVSTPFSAEIRALEDSVFVAGDREAFARAVMQALGDDERRRAMRERIAVPNSWDEKAGEFVRLLVDLTRRS